MGSLQAEQVTGEFASDPNRLLAEPASGILGLFARQSEELGSNLGPFSAENRVKEPIRRTRSINESTSYKIVV